MQLISLIVLLHRRPTNYFHGLAPDTINYLISLLFTGQMPVVRTIGKNKDQVICDGDVGLLRWHHPMVEYLDIFYKRHSQREQVYKNQFNRIKHCVVIDGYILVTRVDQRGILAIRLDRPKEYVIPTMANPTFAVREGKIYLCHCPQRSHAIVSAITIKDRITTIVVSRLAPDSRILDATSNGLILYGEEQISHYNYAGVLLLSYPLNPVDFIDDSTVHMGITKAGLIAVWYDDTIDIFGTNGVRVYQYRDEWLKSSQLIPSKNSLIFFDRGSGTVKILN